MTLSARELAEVVDEVAPAVVGAVVQKVFQPERNGVLLGLYRAGSGGSWLVLSADPALGRLHLIDDKPPGTGEQAPPFCMQLRKELTGARLAALTAVRGERAAELVFERRDPADPDALLRRRLRLYLFGRAAQLVLTDGDGAPLGHLGPAARLHPELPPPRPDVSPAPSRFTGATTVSAAIAAAYATRADDEALARAQAEARARLVATADRLARRVRALEGDRDRADLAEEKRKWGDLLLAHLAEIPRGAASVALPDDFTDGAPLTIPLDPARSARDNAARYYKEHKRLVKALPRIRERLAEATRALAEARTALAGEITSSSALLRARADEAPAAQRARRPSGPAGARRPPYREFRSATGSPILVGRGADRNDELTFKVARGSDLWLHTRDIPGAHVIVPLEGGRPADPETLVDAATLAAYHSSARDEAQVDVGYTLRKYVRKPPKSRPGSVLTSSLKTIRVRMEPARIARLLESLVAEDG